MDNDGAKGKEFKMDLPSIDSFRTGNINIGLYLMASPILLIVSAILTVLFPVWAIWAIIDAATYNPNAENAS